MKVRTNGKKVKELRTRKGWNQDQLAHHVGSTLRTIQRIESGEGAQRAIVSDVAAKFEVLPDEILADEVKAEIGADKDGGWPVTLHRITSGKKLLDQLLWASRLRFDHDLDPGYPLADTITSFVEKCGDIAMVDDPPLPQWDTGFAVASVTEEMDRIGSLNMYLDVLARQHVHVYAGAYTRLYTCQGIKNLEALKDGEKPEYGDQNMIELVSLIHLLSREVPSVTVTVERDPGDELLSREESDEKHAWKKTSPKLTKALGKKDPPDENDGS